MNRVSAWLLLGPGLGLVAVLLVAPLLQILPLGFSEPTLGTLRANGFTLDNYALLFADPYLRGVIVQSLGIAAATTVVAAILAVPLAYFTARSAPRLKGILVILILVPLLAGGVVQSIGWVAILGPSGVLSQLLQHATLLEGPLDILQTPWTLTLIMSLIVLPMIVLALLSSLESVGEASERAAWSLGANRIKAFWTVVLPQIMPGLVAGTSLAFILAFNAYPTPVLVGGSRVAMVAPEIYLAVTRDGNWAAGTALAVVVVALSLVITGLYSKFMSMRFDRWRGITR